MLQQLFRALFGSTAHPGRRLAFAQADVKSEALMMSIEAIDTMELPEALE